MNVRVGASLLMAVPLLAGGLMFRGERAADEQIRQAAVAGTFYPQDPKELGAMVDGFLASTNPQAEKEEILALIAPHAGYAFSGSVAAQSYALLKGRPTHRVVVIAPSHYERFAFSSVYGGDAYSTPLGKIPIDKEFVQRLARANAGIRVSSQGHAALQSGAEHALEVQLPFLQRTLSDFQLVPIVMGEQSYEASRALGVALAELIQGTDTLIVASSDLSHYHTYDEAVALDRKTLNALEGWDYLTLSDNLEMGTWEACGGAPIAAAMIAAERLGATQARVLKYANTGDITGDKSRVVGYSAVALVKAAGAVNREVPRYSLTVGEKRQLLEIARRSVESAVKEKKLYEVPANLPGRLLQDRGAFVTLKENGELRGCIGNTAAIEPLGRTVRDLAVRAALRDPRFPPVNAAELPRLMYEVSVLSPLRRVADIKKIKVGEHGVMIVEGQSRGVSLPQVAAEQHWNRNQFLEATAKKAGLPGSAWRDRNADVFAFTAIAFGEAEAPRNVMPEEPLESNTPGWPARQGPQLPPPLRPQP